MDKGTFIRIAIEKYGNSFDYSLVSESMKPRFPETIICREHGKFRCKPRDHLRCRHSCPRCRSKYSKKPNQLSIESYVERSKLKFDSRYDYSKVDSNATQRSPITVVCPIHGDIQTTMKNHFHSMSGCYECGREKANKASIKLSSLEAIIPRLKVIHGDKYEYISYDVCSRLLVFKCKHGLSTQLIYEHLTGRGCRPCSYEQRTLTENDFIRRAKEVHPDGYSYNLDELKTVNDKITITHKCGHVYRGRVSNHLSGQGCLRCRGSTGENRIAKFLENNEIDFVSQFKLDGYRYRFDFLIPELNMLVEFDGEQHARPIPFFGGVEAYEQRKLNDEKKNQLAKKYGYLMVRISHNHFAEVEKYLLRTIDRYFKYRVNKVFYKNYFDLARSLNISPDALVRDMDEYRTRNVLSPLN